MQRLSWSSIDARSFEQDTYETDESHDEDKREGEDWQSHD